AGRMRRWHCCQYAIMAIFDELAQPFTLGDEMLIVGIDNRLRRSGCARAMANHRDIIGMLFGRPISRQIEELAARFFAKECSNLAERGDLPRVSSARAVIHQRFELVLRHVPRDHRRRDLVIDDRMHGTNAVECDVVHKVANPGSQKCANDVAFLDAIRDVPAGERLHGPIERVEAKFHECLIWGNKWPLEKEKRSFLCQAHGPRLEEKISAAEFLVYIQLFASHLRCRPRQIRIHVILPSARFPSPTLRRSSTIRWQCWRRTLYLRLGAASVQARARFRQRVVSENRWPWFRFLI